MALNEQMREAIQEDIADTRTKKERIDEQMGALKTVGKTVVENIPGVGEAILAKDIAGDVSEGNYASAALGTAALGVGLLPGGDILNKPIKAAAKKLRKQDAEVANKMLKDVDSIDTWKKQNPNPKPQKQNPDIEKAANDLLENKITGKQYRSVVKENMPIVKIEEVPEVPSFTEIVGALDKDKSAKGILGLNKTVKDGTRVASRLDIPAYERFDKWVVSVHDAFDKKGRESLNGDIMGYGKTAILKNVEFKGMSQGAANISAKKNPKGTIARIFGDYYNAEPENVAEYAAQAIKDKNWIQVGYNPFRHGFFYDKNTGMPVKSAEEVIQVGPLVLAKNAQKMKISEAKQVSPKGGIKIRAGKPIEGLQNLKETKTVFNEGGVVMDKQMDLFEPVERGFDDGGLMQEGGTVDPESGNEVPVGSTQEEVRDDIPAQLSEGEFVFPADVVRYIGLENLMRMRQEAKMGLSQMEAMGQMGNSEEATMPDDLPFDMYDLDVEDDGVQDFAQGGVVKAQAGTFVQPQGFTGIGGYQASQFGGYQPQYTPYTPPPVPTGQTMAQQYTPAQQQAVPTINQQAPTFTAMTGTAAPSPGGYDTMETYVNDAGMEMQIPFKDGKPIYPIPEGYTKKGDAVKTAQTTTTTETKAPSVSTESGDDETDPFAGKQTVNLGGTAVKEFTREGLNTYRPGQVKGSTKYAVGSSSSVTGDLSKRPEGGKTGVSRFLSGIVGDVADFGRGLANQDQKTLTKEDGSKITLSEALFQDIMGDRFSGSTNQILSDVFSTQATIEKNFGENYSKDLDNRQARQLAKEAGIEYKGQSLAELIVTGVDSQGNKLKDAFDQEQKAKKEAQAKAAQETGAEKREERERAAADAAKYGISDTNPDGSRKSASEIRSEIADAVTAQALEKERQAAARRSQRGDDDDGAPDQSTYAGSQAYGAETFGISGLAKGGLVDQMEKSGLTPKK